MSEEVVSAAPGRKEILLVMTAGEGPPLGSFWRITAKRSDFYLGTRRPPER